MDAARKARFAVSAVFFCDGAALGGYIAHLADFQNCLHLSNGALGQCLLFSAFGAVTTMPLCGMLIHRFGSRWVTLFGGLGLLIATVLITLAPNVSLFCASFFLIGLTNGQTDVGMNSHSMAVQDRFERPILSAIHGWFSVGGFAGAAGAGLAGRIAATPFQHVSVASLVLLPVLLWGVSWMLPASADKDAEGTCFTLPSLRVLALGTLVMFAMMNEGAVWDWCSVYLRQALQSTPDVGAFGFALASFAMAGGRFFGDAIVHRFGYRDVLLFSSLLSFTGVLLAVASGNIPIAILGFAIAGVGLSNMVPILFRAAARIPGVSAGQGLAAVTTCGYTAFLAGPPLIGFIADRRGLSFALGLISIFSLFIAQSSRRVASGLAAKV